MATTTPAGKCGWNIDRTQYGPKACGWRSTFSTDDYWTLTEAGRDWLAAHNVADTPPA